MSNPLGDDGSFYTANPWDATPWNESAEGNTLQQFGYLTRDQYGVWRNLENPLEMVLAFNGSMPGQWANKTMLADDAKAGLAFAIAGRLGVRECETNSRACRAVNTYIALAGMFPTATFTLVGHGLGGRMAIFVTEVIKKQCLTKSMTRFSLRGLPKERIAKSFAFNPHVMYGVPDYVIELARSSRVGEACELRVVSNIGEYASKCMHETYGDLVCRVETSQGNKHALHNITPDNWRGPWANGASNNNGYRSFYRGHRQSIGLIDDSQDWIDPQE